MRLKFNWITFVGLSLLMGGCKQSSTTTTQSSETFSGIEINIHQQKNDSVFNSHDFIKPLKIVPLEVTDQSIFSQIDKIEKYDDRYFILDKALLRRVLVFDDKGKFLYDIGDLGGGPGEYSEIQDFTINKESGDVIIIGSPSDIYVYSSTGEFKEKQHVCDSYLWTIAWDGCGYMMASDHWTYHEGEHSYLLYAFDDTFHCIGKWVNVLPVQPIGIFAGRSVLSHVNEKTYYADFCTNQIYQYTCGIDSVKTAFQFNFDTPIPNDVIDDADNFMANQQQYDYLTSVLLTQNYILSTCVMAGKEYISVVSLSDGSVLKSGELRWGFPQSYYIGGNRCVSHLDPTEFVPGDSDYFKIENISDDITYLLEWEIKL